MCGNFSLVLDDGFENRFHLRNQKIKFDNMNIRPTADAPIIFSDGVENKVEIAEWSLIPKELPEGKKYSTFNARIERLHESPLYHKPILETRCIVPMNNYFEWHLEEGQTKKDKYSISVIDNKYFGVAGLYKILEIDNKKLICFTIITAPAIKSLSKVHDRMPVVLDKDEEKIWLDPKTESLEIDGILRSEYKSRYEILKV